jgi:hypothetical protein
MAAKAGSIVLASVRSFGDVSPQNGFFTFQMLCTNLSGDTTWNLQFSLDGTNWKNAKEAGTDITGTLSDDVVTLEVVNTAPGVRWRILFAGATTGTVNYLINQRYAN